MSIFDVIRYPISEQFLVQDLDRIPDEILFPWWNTHILNVYLTVHPTYKWIHRAPIYRTIHTYFSNKDRITLCALNLRNT